MAKNLKNNLSSSFIVALLLVFSALIPLVSTSAYTKNYCESKGATYDSGSCVCPAAKHQEWSDGECVCTYGRVWDASKNDCVLSSSDRPILDNTSVPAPSQTNQTTQQQSSGSQQQPAGSSSTNQPSGNTVIDNPLTYNTFEELINHVLGFVTMLALIIVQLIIVYAAFIYMTSEGDPGKIKTAQAMILYAIIGLFIVLLSKAIISIIHGILS